MIMAQLQLLTIQPEVILLIAAATWIGAALATGIPRHRFPSEFPFLFASVGVISSIIGVTELAPPNVDVILTLLGVILFTIIPIVTTVKLYRTYPPRNVGV